jgi:hypothetical protein
VGDWNGWWNLKHGLLFGRFHGFEAYATGYFQTGKRRPAEETIYLKRFSGTNEDWFKISKPFL